MSHTHLLLKHQNHTALDAYLNLVTEANKFSAKKDHKNDFFKIASIIHTRLITLFTNFLSRSSTLEEDKAIAFKKLIAHLNVTALLYPKNKGVIGAHLIQYNALLQKIQPDALAKQGCFTDLAAHITATHGKDNYVLEQVRLIRTHIVGMSEAEKELDAFDKLIDPELLAKSTVVK